MSSFTSSFRPLLAACATIACIEAAIAMVAKPNIVERSNYLNWTYGSDEPFHKLVVHQKLNALVSSLPDIIQVGDSTGFHGIRPGIIGEYLHGLEYLNLSCCANTGFQGYYDIAKFALDHDPKLRTIVLYLSLNNLPRQALMTGDQLIGATKIHDSFVGPWAFIRFPSLALRPILTHVLYHRSLRSLARPNPIADRPYVLDMVRSVQQERGWWAEQDPRLVGATQERYFRSLCGEDDILRLSNWKADLNDAQGEFLPRVEFDKLAALAGSRNATLIIAFHPHPCGQADDTIMRALRNAVATLKGKYSNLFVYPPELFEHWPKEISAGGGHLRIGYELFGSRRLGGFVASALKLPKGPDPGLPPAPAPLVRAGETPLWTGGPASGEWRLHGLAGSASVNASWHVTETDGIGRHRLETTVSGLVPDRYYLLTATYRLVGERVVDLSLKDAVVSGKDAAVGHFGWSRCNSKAGQANRHGDFYDGSMSVNADGSFTCWGIVKLTQDSAVVGLDLLPQNAGAPYQGDGQSGLIIQELALFMRSSPDVLFDLEAHR